MCGQVQLKITSGLSFSFRIKLQDLKHHFKRPEQLWLMQSCSAIISPPQSGLFPDLCRSIIWVFFVWFYYLIGFAFVYLRRDLTMQIRLDSKAASKAILKIASQALRVHTQLLTGIILLLSAPPPSVFFRPSPKGHFLKTLFPLRNLLSM